MIENSIKKYKALLIAIHLKDQSYTQTEDSLDELAALTETLGVEVVDTIIQSREKPDLKTYIGTGKLNDIKTFVEDNEVDYVFIDNELPPKQANNLENALKCMILDRSQVILEIFAQHARTSEAKLQVELARLYYMLPRLVGMWAHLDREKGGIGASKGMGEKQINIDRTLIRKRIRLLEENIEKIDMERKNRSKNRNQCFQVCLVGYTNAGKSTIMNLLTHEHLLVENKLFATLESTTRVINGLTKPDILISDTVGFIKNLPHSLVASFRSTLDVIKDADLLLQVMDASDPNLEEHVLVTTTVLKEIGAQDVPVLLILNKIDQVQEKMDLLLLKRTFPEALQISALESASRELLNQAIVTFFENHFIHECVIIPYEKSELLKQVYNFSIVKEITYEEDGIHITHATTPFNQRRLEAFLH